MTALADMLSSTALGGIADTAGELLPIVMSGLQAGDIVTVKASNGVGLSRIIKKLTEPAPVARAANGT